VKTNPPLPPSHQPAPPTDYTYEGVYHTTFLGWNTNIPTALCAHLILSFFLRQTQLRLHQLSTQLVGAVIVVHEPPSDVDV